MSDTYRPGYAHNVDVEIPQGGDWLMPIGVIAETDEGTEYLIDTTGYTAFLTVRDGGYDGDIVLECNTTNGRIRVGFTPAKWVANTAYGVGQQVVPTTLNGFIYEVTVAGTSHATTEPSGGTPWPTTIGGTVVNGTVTFRAELVETVDNGLVQNLYVEALAAVTQGLTDWGYGVYTMQLLNTFGRLTYWQDGIARLRRETVY
jgi:hypothetical protein